MLWTVIGSCVEGLRQAIHSTSPEFRLSAPRQVSWRSALSRWNAGNEEAPAVSRRGLADLYQVVGTLLIRRKARRKAEHGNRLRIALARAIVGAGQRVVFEPTDLPLARHVFPIIDAVGASFPPRPHAFAVQAGHGSKR